MNTFNVRLSDEMVNGLKKLARQHSAKHDEDVSWSEYLRRMILREINAGRTIKQQPTLQQSIARALGRPLPDDDDDASVIDDAYEQIRTKRNASWRDVS